MTLPTPSASAVEGLARIVAVEGDTLWLEPEQGTSCGHCPSAASCAPGIGSLGSRLAARRFTLQAVPGPAPGLVAGERVVVGVPVDALLKGALLAYGLPLFTALGGGLLAQAVGGDDSAALVSALAGLGGGLLLARAGARRLAARGRLAPRLLRRATACDLKGERS